MSLLFYSSTLALSTPSLFSISNSASVYLKINSLNRPSSTADAAYMTTYWHILTMSSYEYRIFILSDL